MKNNVTTQELIERIVVLEAALDRVDRNRQIESANSDVWILSTAFSVIFMQAGFALLEAGSVRSKNTKHILLKNLCDFMVCAILWWFWGYGIFAQGHSFLGGEEGNFFAMDNQIFVTWIQSYAFASASSTIVSGGVAERMKFNSYFCFSAVMVSWIYPVVAHWGWSSSGWLSKLGFVDVAGSGLVHLVGGMASLIGSAMVGPRYGRFIEVKKSSKKGKKYSVAPEANEEEDSVKGRCCFQKNSHVDRPIKGHSVVLQSMGVFILYASWFSFNSGSTPNGGATRAHMKLAARAAVSTCLGGAGCALGCMLIDMIITGIHSLTAIQNGLLAGMVSVTAACSVIDPWAALLIGVLTSPAYMFISKALIRLQIDDPLDAFAIHGGGGFLGVVACGFFAKREPLLQYWTLLGFPDRAHNGGLFVGGGFRLLGVQLLGVTAIAFWSGIFSILVFFLAKLALGLRVSKDDELLGLDFKYHNGYAYEIELDSYAVKEHNETKIAAMKKAKNKGGSDSESRVSDKELVYTKKSGSSAEKTRVTDSRVSESVGENLNSNINGKSG